MLVEANLRQLINQKPMTTNIISRGDPCQYQSSITQGQAGQSIKQLTQKLKMLVIKLWFCLFQKFPSTYSRPIKRFERLHLISTLITGNYWNKRCPLVLWWNWALVWPCWNVAENKLYNEDTWFLDASNEANPGECHLFGFSFIGHIGLVSRFHQRHNYCCWSFTQFRVYEWNQTWDCCSTLDYSVSKEWLLIRNMADRIVLDF